MSERILHPGPDDQGGRSEMPASPVGTRELSEAVMATADLFSSRHWKWWDHTYPVDSRDPNALRVPDVEQIMHHVLYLVRRAANREDGWASGGRLMVQVCDPVCGCVEETGLRCAQVYVQVGEVKVR